MRKLSNYLIRWLAIHRRCMVEKICDWENFWEFLLYEADTYWLKGWLENKRYEYKLAEICPACGSRARKNDEYIWSETKHHILARKIICARCERVIDVQDMRPILKKELSLGAIQTRHIEILKKELGEPLDGRDS